MTDVISYAAAAVFLCFAALRLSSTRGEPTQRCITAFALCIGSALVINAPVSLLALVGFRQAAAADVVLAHGLKAASFTCLALIARTLRRSGADRARMRRHVVVGAGVQAVSLALFLVSSVSVDEDAVVIGAGRVPYFAAYDVLFAVYGVGCLVSLIGALARHIRREPPGLLRIGLVLMALSAAFGALWTLWTAHDLADTVLNGRQGLGEDLPSTCFGVAVAVLAAAGVSATRWPVLLRGPLGWIQAHRSYRALEPLWSALHAELPEIALAPHTAGRWTRFRGGKFALYRRVIEIRDALLMLGPYFGSAPRAQGAGIPADGNRESEGDGRADEDADEAAQEATAIKAALDNRRRGRGTPATRGEPAPSWQVAGTLDAETAWLLQVSRAFVSNGRTPSSRTDRASSPPEPPSSRT